jgi:BREX protein BrxB
MPSLDETFAALTGYLRQPDALNPAKSDPFLYFVHDPSETLTVKQKLGVWSSALRNEGWEVEQVSLSKLLWQIVESSGRWDEWLELEPDADAEAMNEAIRDVLRTDNALVEALASYLSKERERTVVFVTDTAALHPYFRARSLESGLHDRVKVPSVIFYPGRREGQYGLHFLGFYEFDGNYRATLLGGLE